MDGSLRMVGISLLGVEVGLNAVERKVWKDWVENVCRLLSLSGLFDLFLSKGGDSGSSVLEA